MKNVDYKIIKNYIFHEKWISKILLFCFFYLILYELKLIDKSIYLNIVGVKTNGPNILSIRLGYFISKLLYSIFTGLILFFFIDYYPRSKDLYLYYETNSSFILMLINRILNLNTYFYLLLETRAGRKFDNSSVISVRKDFQDILYSKNNHIKLFKESKYYSNYLAMLCQDKKITNRDKNIK